MKKKIIKTPEEKYYQATCVCGCEFVGKLDYIADVDCTWIYDDRLGYKRPEIEYNITCPYCDNRGGIKELEWVDKEYYDNM